MIKNLKAIQITDKEKHMDIKKRYAQGELSPDVAKAANEKLAIDPNAKVKQGTVGPDHALGKKEKVDASIFKMAEKRDY